MLALTHGGSNNSAMIHTHGTPGQEHFDVGVGRPTASDWLEQVVEDIQGINARGLEFHPRQDASFTHVPPHVVAELDTASGSREEQQQWVNTTIENALEDKPEQIPSIRDGLIL